MEEIASLKAEVEQLRAALEALIDHTHHCEKQLTEDLYHADFCGESLPLTNARKIASLEPRTCPVCNGDCAGANPPVIYCPMMEPRND